MTILELLPAIDVTGGQAVRLSAGSIDEGSWGSPIDVARSFDEAGARSCSPCALGTVGCAGAAHASMRTLTPQVEPWALQCTR